MSIVYILVVFLIFYFAQSHIYEKNWNKSLEAEVKFSHNEIFEGEATEVIRTISNNKLIPMRWFTLQFPLSRYLIFENEDQKPRVKEILKKSFYTLLSYEKVTSKEKVRAFKRGIYDINEFSILSGDLFGRYKFIENRKNNARLCVYPRIISVPEFKLLLNRLTGDIVSKRHVIEDPFIFKTIRDYTPYDSQKLINWQASAKTLDLKVNQFDHTSSSEILILLNTDKYNDWDNEVLMEESIRLAASISSAFIEKGLRVKFIANSFVCDTKEELSISSKSGKAQISLILESLAELNVKNNSRPMKQVLEECTRTRANLQTILLISYYHGPDLSDMVRKASEEGTYINWIVPKLKHEHIKLEPAEAIYFWEVSDHERAI